MKTKTLGAFVLTFILSTNNSRGALERNPLLATLEKNLVGKTFTMRHDFNVAAKQYYKIGQTEFQCRHTLTGLFPKQQELPGVSITRVRQISEMELLKRTTQMEGNHVISHDVNKEFRCWQFSLKHQHLGKGAITITTMKGDLPAREEEILQVLGFVLSGNGLSSPARLKATKSSALVHFVGSGHAPEQGETVTFNDLTEAQGAGYRACNLCFNRWLRLAYVNDERALGAETEAQFRLRHQVSTDAALQARVERLGRKVLSNWPGRPLGYDYRFTVVEGSDVNACACAGGYIFVETGLIKILESDQELEAVLAHEIAHIEQRHGIKELLRAKHDRDAAAVFSTILGGVVSVAVAASTKSDPGKIAQDAAQAAAAFGFWIYAIGSQIGRLGYTREHEMEADIYALTYFRKMGYSQSHLLSVLRKIRTSVDLLNPNSPDEADMSSSHPTPNNRLHIAQNITVDSWTKPVVFDAFNKDGELVYSIAFEGVCNYEKRDGADYCRLLLDVITTEALEKVRPLDELRLTVGSTAQTFRSDGAYSLAPMDRMGMTFVYKGKLSLKPEGISSPKLEGIPVSTITRRALGD